MSQKTRKATRIHREKAASRSRVIRLTISYREAAKILGRSKSHIHAVCNGERQSQDLSSRLKPYIAA